MSRETLASILRDCDRRIQIARVKALDPHVHPKSVLHAVELAHTGIAAAVREARRITE